MTSGGWLTRIAEADAGLPDEATAARVLAAGDAGTEAVVRALDATRADLRTLGRERMPISLAGSLATALDAVDAATDMGPEIGTAGEAEIDGGSRGGDEAGGAGSSEAGGGPRDEGLPTDLCTARTDAAPTDPRTARTPAAPNDPRTARTPASPGSRRPSGPGRRPTRRRRRGLLLTAAAAALVGVALTGPGPTPTDLAAASGRVLAEQTREVGVLADPATLSSCLLRAGVPEPTGSLLAGRPIRLDGVDGTFLVLSTGKLGVVRAIVVTPDCGRLLADQTVGG
jgi:hypothetical protein